MAQKVEQRRYIIYIYISRLIEEGNEFQWMSMAGMEEDETILNMGCATGEEATRRCESGASSLGWFGW